MKKTLHLVTLTCSFFIAVCSHSNQASPLYCKQKPKCITKDTDFMHFMEKAAKCNDAHYVFHYNFGSARLKTNKNQACKTKNSSIITVKTEIELSDYNVYSCSLRAIKAIAWQAQKDRPPNTLLKNTCTFIGTEKLAIERPSIEKK